MQFEKVKLELYMEAVWVLTRVDGSKQYYGSEEAAIDAYYAELREEIF